MTKIVLGFHRNTKWWLTRTIYKIKFKKRERERNPALQASPQDPDLGGLLKDTLSLQLP